MHWKRFASVGLLSFLAACTDPVQPPNRMVFDASVASVATETDCLGCVIDTTFTRARGKPDTYVLVFLGDPTADYIIAIDDGGSKRANAEVALNGKNLLKSEDDRDDGHDEMDGDRSRDRREDEEDDRRRFSHAPMRRAVTLLASNRLRVRLTGKPGSRLRVRLLGGVKSIGVNGGTLHAPGGVSLTIAAAALSQTQEITAVVTPLDENEPGKGMRVSLTPSGLHFDTPALLVLPLTVTEAGGPSVWFRNPETGEYDFVDAGMDPESGQLTAAIWHFSEYSALFPVFRPGTDVTLRLVGAPPLSGFGSQQGAVPLWNVALIRAIRLWREATKSKYNVRIVDPDDETALITVKFAPFLSSSTLGRTSILPAAFDGVATSSDPRVVTLNSGIRWSSYLVEGLDASRRYYDLEDVAAHEIGHALGLNHNHFWACFRYAINPFDWSTPPQCVRENGGLMAPYSRDWPYLVPLQPLDSANAQGTLQLPQAPLVARTLEATTDAASYTAGSDVLVEGHVYSASGAPMQLASIWAEFSGPNVNELRRGTTVTDVNGYFRTVVRSDSSWRGAVRLVIYASSQAPVDLIVRKDLTFTPSVPVAVPPSLLGEFRGTVANQTATLLVTEEGGIAVAKLQMPARSLEGLTQISISGSTVNMYRPSDDAWLYMQLGTSGSQSTLTGAYHEDGFADRPIDLTRVTTGTGADCGSELSGLSACWALNGNAADATGGGANGSVTGAMSGVGRYGNAGGALQFSSAGQIVTVPLTPAINTAPTDAFTVSGWFRADARAPGNDGLNTNFLVSGGVSAVGSTFGWSVQLLQASVWVNACGPAACSGGGNTASAYALDRWTHFAYSFGGGQLRLYIDGVLAFSTSFAVSASGTTANYLMMGGNLAAPSYTMRGALDDIRFYRRVLSAQEVQTLYNATRP